MKTELTLGVKQAYMLDLLVLSSIKGFIAGIFGALKHFVQLESPLNQAHLNWKMIQYDKSELSSKAATFNNLSNFP